MAMLRWCAIAVSPGTSSDGIQVNTYALVTGNRCDGNGPNPGDGAGIHATNANNLIEDNFVS